MKYQLRKTKLGNLLFITGKSLYFLFKEGPERTYARIEDYLQNRSYKGSEYGNGLSTKDMEMPYSSFYEDDEDYSAYKTSVKPLAFYLPQFHCIPENDNWWGKDFTEWTNTKKSKPRFLGHYQPREPHDDIGYYDLSDIATIRKQVLLAKKHGVYGFCFYYYWFSGKRLLEKPVDMLCEHNDIDFPFCLCWANENWTRTWDGENNDVLISQKYKKDDPERFIEDIRKYIEDERYIRIHGKPVILVYSLGSIPNVEDVVFRWKKHAEKIGIGDILIWACNTTKKNRKNITDIVDAEIQFPPHNTNLVNGVIRDLELHGKDAYIFDYNKVVEAGIRDINNIHLSDIPIYRTCMLGWDNAARRNNNWTTYYGYSTRGFYNWFKAICEDTEKRFSEEERFVFINAWNEWAEGTYLEPDKKYGYAGINTFSKALYSLPYREEQYLTVKHVNIADIVNSRIAIHVHVYYIDTISEIISYLNNIPVKFDCYVSTDNDEKKRIICDRFTLIGNMNNLSVDIFPNRGRDVAPLLMQMRGVISKYDFICHIHSKKTIDSNYGDSWRTYLFESLLGNEDIVLSVLSAFAEDNKIGMIFPETYAELQNQAEWGGNVQGCLELLEKMGIGEYFDSNPVFPVGNMFWARTKALKPLFDLNLTSESFQEEKGQKNLTLAHEIERLWVPIVLAKGYTYKKIGITKNGLSRIDI